MRLAKTTEIRSLEKAQYARGLAENELMERAARAASDWILGHLLNQENKKTITIHAGVPPAPQRILIVAGPGNNGGDALLVAKNLISHLGFPLGFELKCFTDQQIHFSQKGFSPEFVTDLLNPSHIQSCKQFLSEKLCESDLLLDGLFGIGLNRPLRGTELAIVQKMNGSKGKIISLDCPSGLQADTGRILGLAVKAYFTLSFGFLKPGFYLQSGPEFCGKIIRLDIGFSPDLSRVLAKSCFLFGKSWARRTLPVRPDTANKSHGGRCLILAGSSGMWGAGVLAAKGAARVGAGYVYWANKDAGNSQVLEAPDFLTLSGQPGDLEKSFRKIKFNSLVFGPGLGGSEQSYLQLKKIMELSHKYEFPVVLDADGINLLGKKKISELPKNWILTPHAGELARILGSSATEIDSDPMAAVREACQRFGCLVFLKGFHSLLGFEDKVIIINSGNKALAKAGTGDVLSGMMGGFLSQGLSPARAACLAAYLHGQIADNWVCSGKDYLSFMASDLLDLIPSALAQLRPARSKIKKNIFSK